MPHASPLVRVYEWKVREARLIEGTFNTLKLIMALAGRGVYDESF